MGIKKGFMGYFLITAGVIMLAATGCGKKTQQESAKQEAAPMGVPAEHGALPQGHPAIGEQPAADMGKVSHANIKTQKEVALQEDVLAKWKEVKMEVSDSSSKTTEVLTLKVGEIAPLKKSGLKLKVEAFVPDYSIVENHIESRSNEPKNPAVLVELVEGDKTVARGWVFKFFPEFNSYNNERIRLSLVAPGAEKPGAARK